MRITVAIKTIGCRLNQAESQEWAATFARAGFLMMSEKQPADWLIVNSCAVTADAARKSRQALRAYHHRWPLAKIAVIGCGEPELHGLPEVDLAIPLKDKARVVEIINRQVKSQKSKVKNSAPSWVNNRTRALVKIQDGCDEFCTYCIVPFRRGRPRSVPPRQVLGTIKRLEIAGAKEIVLTGVHIGRYLYRGLTLAGLVKKILAQTGIPRIRFSSIEPQHFTPAILKLFRSSRICPFLHLPIQSGSNRILRVMHRRYTTRQLAGVIGRIHKAVPGISLSTDVIVGFPGEMEADFARTMKFCRRMDFAKIHVFSYSKREGTAAARLSGQVPAAVMATRSLKLRRLSDQLNLKYRRRLRGKRLEVLLETSHAGTSREGLKVNFQRKLNPHMLGAARIPVHTPNQTNAKLL